MWRNEHRDELALAVRVYDAARERIAAYAERLREELAAQPCEELRAKVLPEPPDPRPERALRVGHGQSAAVIDQRDGFPEGALRVPTIRAVDPLAVPGQRLRARAARIVQRCATRSKALGSRCASTSWKVVSKCLVPLRTPVERADPGLQVLSRQSLGKRFRVRAARPA